MISLLVYLLGAITLILHFSGVLVRNKLQWLILVAPVAIFAANILDLLTIT